MSVDVTEGDDAAQTVGDELEAAVAREFGVDVDDIRVRIEHQPLAGACDEDYLSTLKADWIGDGPEAGR